MQHDNLKIGIIGVGMVGGPLKRFFEERNDYRAGENLLLFDTDPAKNFSHDINRADIVFICVPTPRSEGGAVKLNAVESAFLRINGERIVVIKSTVPPGTSEYFQKKYPQHRVLFNPEFLTEAHAWENTIAPDRQLVGWTAKSRDAARVVLSLLPSAPLVAPSAKFELTATEAELVKYAANTFLTRKITFANAIYDLAEHHHADYENVRKGIAADSRIGPSHLDVHHGGYRGYGGYCFVKDTDALIAHAQGCGLYHVASLFESDRAYNVKLLSTQGLIPEDVSVHDREWVQKKLKTESEKLKIKGEQ